MVDQSNGGMAGSDSTLPAAAPPTSESPNEATQKTAETIKVDPPDTQPAADNKPPEQKQPGANGDQGADPKHTGSSTEPAFKFDWSGIAEKDKNESGFPKDAKLYDAFNLRPLPDRKFPIPEDQRKISQEVYEARNILKLLNEHVSRWPFPEVIKPALYDEFIARALQAGEVGCVATYVHPILAAGALEQIRADIVRRVGMSLVYTYLAALAVWAMVGLAMGVGASELVGGIAARVGHSTAWEPINGYKWLLLGAMVGAWFSVAARRREVGFGNLPLYLDRVFEPAIRVLFVALVAAVFALFLYLHFLTIDLGSVHFNNFDKSIGVALFAGFVAGISERALSAQLIGEARKAFPGAKGSTDT